MIRKTTIRVDTIMCVVIWGVATALFCSMIVVMYQMIGPGFTDFTWDFIVSAPEDAGRAGGIASILLSTLLILAVSLAAALPVGLSTAIWLAEFVDANNMLGRNVRRGLDICAGVPSIVFGLFGNAFFCRYLGMGFSILSGGLTLACMILPVLVRTAEIGFRSVPGEYQLSGKALGLSRFTILRRLTLPWALPAITAGLLLSIGRAVAETAALIFTSGYVTRMPESLHDSGRALSVHIYDLAMNVPGGETNAFKSVLVIMTLLTLINSFFILLANHWRRAGLVLA